MNVKANLYSVLEDIPDGVALIAVSKTHPVEMIAQVYEAGQRRFGENKAQELIRKAPLLPDDIEWHFIGHLQTNKVKQIIPWVQMIHSIDSFKLLSEVSKEAVKANRIVDCLLQLYIATEESKFGLDLEEAREVVRLTQLESLGNIRIRGVMGMATNTDDNNLIASEFRTLKSYFEDLKGVFFRDTVYFNTISMGMSSDYKLAIECGSTMVRVGSLIFGQRTYSL
jgi:pyridoxal phosphate enzyme (YggS family)